TILETERLLLREFVMDDVEVFYCLGTDPVVTRYTGDGGFTTIEQAREVLCARPLADYRKYGFGRWACVLKQSGAVIGFAGLTCLEDLKEVDLGYRLLPAHWGAGLATEASRATIRYGFDKLDLAEIIGLVAPENVASVRVLEKCGLTFAGMVEYRSEQV